MDISGLLNNEPLSFSSCSPGFPGLAPVSASSGFSVSNSNFPRIDFSPVATRSALFLRSASHVAGLICRCAFSAWRLQCNLAKIASNLGESAAHEFNQRIVDASVGWSVPSGRIVFCSAR
jgi:hypothetical protein